MAASKAVAGNFNEGAAALDWTASVAYSRLQDAAKAHPTKTGDATVPYCEKVGAIVDGFKLKNITLDNPKCKTDGYQIMGYVTEKDKAKFSPFANPTNPPKVAYVPKDLRPIDTQAMAFTGAFGGAMGGFVGGFGIALVTGAAALNPLAVGVGAVVGAGLFIYANYYSRD